MKTLPEQLLELMPMASTATEGPWHIVEDNDGVVASYLLTPQADSYVDSEGKYNDFANIVDQSDAAFIVAARALLTPKNLMHIYACVKVIADSRSKP